KIVRRRVQRDRFHGECAPESSPAAKKPKLLKTAKMEISGERLIGGGGWWLAEVRPELAVLHRSVACTDGGRSWAGVRRPNGRRKKKKKKKKEEEEIWGGGARGGEREKKIFSFFFLIWSKDQNTLQKYRFLQ
ncbi:hypothetical protein TorRG33x02_141650, partial [Trema orientale]